MKTKKDAIPVVFSTDNNYAPYLAVTLKSLVTHISPDTSYHIIILHDGLPNRQQQRLLEITQPCSNVQTKFINIIEHIDKQQIEKAFRKTIGHITVAAYYRLFIPDILTEYDKIIYLDIDVIVERDIADLFHTEIGDNWLGAVRDPGVKLWPLLHTYATDTLQISDTRNYFNSGVLIMDIDSFRRFNLTQTCLEKLNELREPLCYDQDVLNAVFQNHVAYLHSSWNCIWTIVGNPARLQSVMPPEDYRLLLEETEHPSIIHYATGEKAWSHPELPLAERFWHYARQTSYYEEIIFRNTITRASGLLHNKPLLESILTIASHRQLKWRCLAASIVATLIPTERNRQKKASLRRRIKNANAILRSMRDNQN